MDRRARVLLEVEVQELEERELGPMDPNTVGATLATYAKDTLHYATRGGDFPYPWRVVDVKLVPNP